jgi:hypothetical protein
MVRSIAALAAGPNCFAASASVCASIWKLIGSAPTVLITCVSPTQVTLRDASGAPLPSTGVILRIVPTRRSV